MERRDRRCRLCLYFLALLSGLLAWPVQAELQVSPYASLRAQIEAVSVEEAVDGEDDSFIGIRDAFSRFGLRADYALGEGNQLGAQLEIPFNMANFNAEDASFFDDNSVRIAKMTADGEWGSAWLGKGWLPYYNNVAYPVDLFSSFYSGWATYARFREYAAAYSTPPFHGLTLTAAAIRLDPSKEDGSHYVASYTAGAYTLAYAYEDMDSDNASNNGDTHGLTLSFSRGPFYLALKGEEHMPEVGADAVIKNLYASYTFNRYTFKGMVADADDGYWAPGTSVHFGVDFQYRDSVLFFAEYFAEEKSYAILKTDADFYDPLAPYSEDSDGQALLIGARYDF